MEIHNITAKGDFITQSISTSASWTPQDKGRIVYVEDEGMFYFGGDDGWFVNSTSSSGTSGTTGTDAIAGLAIPYYYAVSNQPFYSTTWTSNITGFQAARVNDGNKVTGVTDSVATDNAIYIELDLGAGNAKEFIGVTFTILGSGLPYYWSYSDDGSAWTNMSSKITLVGDNLDEWESVGSHRYWKLTTYAVFNWGYSSIKEIQFHEPGGTIPYKKYIKPNSATMSSVTSLDIATIDRNDRDVTFWANSLDDSTNTTHRGTLYFEKEGTDGATYAVFSITGAVTTSGDFVTCPVTYVSTSGSFVDNDEITAIFYRTGNAGSSGSSGTSGQSGTSGSSGTSGAAGVAAAAGSDTQVQFNDGGTNLGADAGLVYDKNTKALSIADGLLYLTAAAVAHGMTTIAPTTAYAKFTYNSASVGGVNFTGFSDTVSGYEHSIKIQALVNGDISPYGATTCGIRIQLARSNGTGIQWSGGCVMGLDDLNVGQTWGLWAHGVQTWTYPGGLSHGITTVFNTTDTFGQIGNRLGANDGGFDIRGVSKSAGTSAIRLYGVNASGTPTASSLVFTGCKKNGTGVQSLTGTEPVLSVYNAATLLSTMYGDGTFKTKRVQFDPVDLVDKEVFGEVFPGTVGVSAAQFSVLHYNGTEGVYDLADADASSTMPAVAMLTETVSSSGSSKRLLNRGWVRDDTWNWTRGGLLYVDITTSGGMTQISPSGSGDQVQIVGYAYSADIIYFNPQYTIVEVL